MYSAPQGTNLQAGTDRSPAAEANQWAAISAILELTPESVVYVMHILPLRLLFYTEAKSNQIAPSLWKAGIGGITVVLIHTPSELFEFSKFPDPSTLE